MPTDVADIPEDAAQASEDGSTPPEGTGTDPQEEATLKSRLEGLQARNTELGRQRAEAERLRDAVQKQLDAIQAGQVDADESLKARLKSESDRADAAERKAVLAEIKTAYPETFDVFGEATANMAPEALAAAEARFKGQAPVDSEPPTPRGNNGPRATGSGTPRAETIEDVKAQLAQVGVPWQQ